MDTLGERIVHLRDLHGLSQRKLMNELNITNLGRIEKNVGSPSADIILSIAQYFNVSTDWILTGQEYNGDKSPLNSKDGEMLRIFNKLDESDKQKFTSFMEVTINSYGNKS